MWTGKPPKEAERSHRGGLWMLTGPLFLQAQQPSPVPGQHGRPRGARGLPRLSCTRRRVGGWGTPGFLSLAQEPVPADSAMALLPGFQSTVALTTTPCSAHTHGVLHQPPGAYGETEGWGAVRGTFHGDRKRLPSALVHQAGQFCQHSIISQDGQDPLPWREPSVRETGEASSRMG